MNIIIETERLILRKFMAEDAAAAMYNSRTPKVAHFMSDMVLHTEKEAVDWINWINTKKFNPDRPFVLLAVVLKETGVCMGLVGVAPKGELDNQIEVLFSIADDYQNKGYITEGASALINWVFAHEKAEWVVAIAKRDNRASNRVIEKLGFSYVGEKNIDYDGRMTDFHYYRFEKPVALEAMDDFFASRVDSYDAHMLSNVEGCKEGYVKMGQIVAEHYHQAKMRSLPLLDLGCGTGLELEEIFKRLPALSVTGIDLTRAMLDKLQEKFERKDLRLICGSYFDVDFGKCAYGCAVSFQTMHHFAHEKKTALYQRLCAALGRGGIYVECDYMVERQEDEDLFFAQCNRLRNEQKIPEEAFFHYDTPCTIENQIAMLKRAGFSEVKQVFRIENTTILVATK